MINYKQKQDALNEIKYMTLDELKQIIAKGETITVQFKIRMDDAYKINRSLFCDL